MLQRYLGNKSSLTGTIIDIVNRIAQPGDIVCDPFSGSLAVSFALKKAGYQVASNDINLFSWVYATAYLSSSSLPPLRLTDIVGNSEKLVRDALLHASSDTELLMGAWESEGTLEDAANWVGLIDYVFVPYKRSDVPRTLRRTDFYDHYCAEGSKSGFVSSRGSTGNRRYLSSENAAALDRAMNRIRFWYRDGRISLQARCLITALVLDAVERVANIQGTYHDFPRDIYDPRSLKSISARLPHPSDFVIGPASEYVGKALDSLEFVKSVPKHAVLYLDPPYNFRQYTSYYFLPNLICEYVEIDDLDQYFSEVKYVRGQNLRSEFKSTFCSANQFISSLTQIVQSSQCRHVVLSYFNGRNHWNTFKSGTSNRGREELEQFFSSELFESGSLAVHPVDRLNYQSYGGHKALEVSEYLFVARKKVLSKKRGHLKEDAYAVV